MAKGAAEVVIDRPADEVWARVGNFADPSWIPTVDWSEVDGDLRTTRERGHESQQRLVAHDDEARTLSYVLASEVRLPDGQLAKVSATISVTPEGPSSSRMSWGYDTGPDDTHGQIGDFYGSILATLKQTLEGTT